MTRATPSQSREGDRRRYGRIQLDDDPLPATIDLVPVRIIELSVVGFRVEHTDRFPGNLERRELKLTWEGKMMQFACSVVRSTMHQLARRAGEKSIYHSGIRIEEPIGDSDLMLRDFIASRIIRALEEQKANARGIPPLGGYTYQVGKSNRFRRCEMVDGMWRKTETNRTEQPVSGFTISAEIDPTQIDLLCRTYQGLNEEGRRLTQILAELSIRKEEGTPTRRYVP